MNKKAGRPTDNPKNTGKYVRFSDSDIEKLNYCVEKTGKSEAEVIRIGLDMAYRRLFTGKQSDIQFLENWNADLETFGDEQEAIEVHNHCISALIENDEIKEVLSRCKKIMEVSGNSQDVMNDIDAYLQPKE